jgi:hypothetical protein
MTKKMITKKIVLSYFLLLIVTFVVLYIFINPMIQDAYNKGYERGLGENCQEVLEKISQDSQVPFQINTFTLSKPAGNQS